jgi:ABC-type polysaccharide/polyol phosphate transport system ATPase subunit
MSAVKVERVWKRFALPTRRSRSVREVLQSLGGLRVGLDAFWALQDVSFELEAGQSIGLIGPNGSGKSTILKLVCGISRPTAGRVRVRGTVSSLIELGAGFHPEFSGRDNVYLYGALLGLSRTQVCKRFDSIVDFADLGAFIDGPVKHYSSGMLMRLAFSVAAHVEPDILLIDEVLAVGDVAFQRKCLERVSAMRRQGVSILYVSHAMETVLAVCDEVIWLDHGRIHRVGNPTDVVTSYLRSVELPPPTTPDSAELRLRGGSAAELGARPE